MNITKLTSGFLIAGLTVSAANAAPSYIKRDVNGGGYNVTYDYKDKEKNRWYTAFRAELNLLSWENEYSSTDVPNAGSDKYSMESVFGGSVSVGQRYDYFWRWDIEAGYTGKYEDSDASTSFSLSVPYVLANMMYDFTSGMYLGAGFGAAFPTTTLDGDLWTADTARKEVGVSPMGAVMAGYSRKLDDNLVLDLRYRLSGFSGTKQVRTYETDNTKTFTNDIGLIFENSVSVALRYEF